MKIGTCPDPSPDRRPDPSPDRRVGPNPDPADGPSRGPDVVAAVVAPEVHAWRAADAIRSLNRATLAGTGPAVGYRYPSDVDAVIGALQTLADRLPQALAQIGAWLHAQDRRGRVSHDRLPYRWNADEGSQDAPADRRGTGSASGQAGHLSSLDQIPAAAVREVLADLDAATHAAGDLARALRRARSVSTHLTGTGK